MDPNGVGNLHWRTIRRHLRTTGCEHEVSEWATAHGKFRDDGPTVLLEGHADVARRNLKIGLAQQENVGHLDHCRSAGSFAKSSQARRRRRRGGHRYRLWK